MKRLHVSLTVTDLGKAVGFYSTLFDGEPTVLKPDYAKWMLDDPRVNFVVSTGSGPGLSHFGIQAETPDELAEVTARLEAAETPVLKEQGARCCYAVSDKTWAKDPDGIAWESFHTTGAITTYGRGTDGLAELPAAG